MGLVKSRGNMYSWVTHMHTHLAGECPHKCTYCYVGTNRWGRAEKYTGNIRLLEHELQVDYGMNKIIFIEHMNDMFADGVSMEFIKKILNHCCKYPDNTYVFQTKNPARILDFVELLPVKIMFGTTIETNRDITITTAPKPIYRYFAMMEIKQRLHDIDMFVTIEPIMDFDIEELVKMLTNIKPSFINIGADSKNCGLIEPSVIKVQTLIRQINQRGLSIKIKHNLQRFLV